MFNSSKELKSIGYLKNLSQRLYEIESEVRPIKYSQINKYYKVEGGTFDNETSLHFFKLS